jgi:anti-sigma regulatory factor (Ser/Thr protein kinase)
MRGSWIENWDGVRKVSLAGVPSSVRAARRFVGRVLLESGVSLGLVEDAVLLASELATNAVIHALTDFVVGVEARGDWVWVGVADGAPGAVTTARLPSEAAGGRGLLFVDSVAPRWGSEPIDGGKVVWFSLMRG